jgi:Pyruvate-formate lyase
MQGRTPSTLTPAERIRILSEEGLQIVREHRHPVSAEKTRLMTEAFQATEGAPTIVRTTAALKHVLANCTVRIEPEELLVGNPTSVPWGVEATHLWALWPDSELDALVENGFQISDETIAELKALNAYWKGRTLTSRMTQLYDDDRVWPYAQLGVVLPPYREKAEGWGGGGMLGGGYGIHHEISQVSTVPLYERVLAEGVDAIVAEARAELAKTHLFGPEAFDKADFLRSVIDSLEALVAFAGRFADEARRQAAACDDPRRKAELERIAEICANVPAKPAQNFREALQAYWFVILLILPAGVLGMGRLDQLFAPYYEADVAAGRITDEEVIELFACLRIRSQEILITGGSSHRSKWAAGTKWHHAVIGGQTTTGVDATNKLTYLILDAAELCPTPHHTITMRVHEGTPPELLERAVRLWKTGLGQPALINDQSVIDYLLSNGVPIELARDYGLAGDLTVSVPGNSRFAAGPMMIVPRMVEIAVNGGHDPRTGRQAGPETGALEEHETWESFLDAMLTQMDTFLRLQAEFNNVTIRAMSEHYPHTMASALMDKAFEVGKGLLRRNFVYDNASALNPIGMVNAGNALYAIKKLVFDDKVVTAKELRDALSADWQVPGGEALRERCLTVAKFGQGETEVDDLVALLYRHWADTTVTFTTSYGGKFKPSAITIGTANVPGGDITGATADGRRAGSALATESNTPVPGTDDRGPWATIRSAARLDHTKWLAMALDLGFTRSALASEQSEAELIELVRDYFRNGGKHMQVNVVDLDVLHDALENPRAHDDLLVRLGGTSTYFTQMDPVFQEDFLRRTFHEDVSKGR